MAEELSPHLKSLVEKTVSAVRVKLESGKHIDSMALILNSADADAALVVVHMDNRNQLRKLDSAEKVRMEVIKRHADAVLLITEAWVLGTEGKTKEESMALYDDVLNRYGSIGNSPDKLDMAFFRLELASGVWAGMAQIQKVKGGRTFGEVKLNKVDEASGTYSDFFHKSRQI